jgi:rubrerythrin
VIKITSLSLRTDGRSITLVDRKMRKQEGSFMKITLYVTGVIVMAALLAIGATGPQKRSPLSKETQVNLATAMRGEAMAYAKYTLYAQQARNHGKKQLAAVFERAARMERFQHFAKEADLVGLVGSDADNLRDAIKGESYEVDTMYREFAQQAAAAGDKAVADRFEEIRHDEMIHRDAFKAALSMPEVQRVDAH